MKENALQNRKVLNTPSRISSNQLLFISIIIIIIIIIKKQIKL